MADRELRPVGRYEWEQIIRRARLGSVIAGSGRLGANGKPTKGGMTGNTFTGIALGWASYADDKGQDIYPGDATVAVGLETTIKAVREVRQALIDLGLLQFVCPRTSRRGDEYRLTIPSDLDDHVEVLTPAQHTLAAGRLRDQSRGKRKAPGGPPEPPSLGGPADHPESSDHTNPGSPADHPAPDSAAKPGWSGGPTEIASGWSGGPRLGGPADRSTDQDRTTSTTDHSDDDLRTAVTVARAREAAEEPNFPPDVEPDTPTPLRLIEGNPNPAPDPTPRALWPVAVPDPPADPPPAATRALGWCLACYAAGTFTLAVDDIAGDACAHHLRLRSTG